MALAFLCVAPGVASEESSTDLLRAALDPNPRLLSYTGSVTLVAQLRFPIPLRRTLEGSVTYRRPARTIVFVNLPSMLHGFEELSSGPPSYAQVALDYDIVRTSDDGKITVYLLTPKDKSARVRAVHVAIGDASHLAQTLTWEYANGARLDVAYTYLAVDAFQLPDTVTLHIRFPAYNAFGTLRFSNYRIGEVELRRSRESSSQLLELTGLASCHHSSAQIGA